MTPLLRMPRCLDRLNCCSRGSFCPAKILELGCGLPAALGLGPRDWLLLLECLVELARTDAQLSLLPYERWRERLARARRADGLGRCEIWPPRATRTVRLFAAVARRYPRPATCLVRALALHTLLARRGIQTTLRIGVRRTDDSEASPGIDAHAWLVQAQRPVYEAPAAIDLDPHLPLQSPP